jgi:hypothetical protein
MLNPELKILENKNAMALIDEMVNNGIISWTFEYQSAIDPVTLGFKATAYSFSLVNADYEKQGIWFGDTRYANIASPLKENLTTLIPTFLYLVTDYLADTTVDGSGEIKMARSGYEVSMTWDHEPNSNADMLSKSFSKLALDDKRLLRDNVQRYFAKTTLSAHRRQYPNTRG